MEHWLGWSSSLVLLFTLLGQVVKQWRSSSVEGVSSWLFFGQITASIGFVTYSVLIDNGVFIVTNTLILLTAIIGHLIYRYKYRQQAVLSADHSRD